MWTDTKEIKESDAEDPGGTEAWKGNLEVDVAQSGQMLSNKQYKNSVKRAPSKQLSAELQEVNVNRPYRVIYVTLC